MTDLLVRTESLGGSELARAALAGAAPAGWYPVLPAAVEEWRRHLETVRESAGDWSARLAPAIQAGGEAARRLAASAGGRGVVVTTGQQPGLFGGPVYTWSKALSALALADELERATGIPVAPVFWAATDDADFAEAAATWVAGPEGAERLELDPPELDGMPLSRVPLGDVTLQLDALARAAGSAANPAPVEAARRAYAEGTTVGDAYLALLRALLEPLGIAVLDASHAAVREAADTVLRRALRDAASLADAVDRRAEEITRAGYSPQVTPVPGLSLVALTDDAGKTRVSMSDAARVAGDAASVLGTTVLLRPVVERAILPTAAYVAGPGEIAYFAQVSAVADALDAARPVVVPRWSCTVLEPRTRELLDEYGLTVDALADPHAPERDLASALLPAGVKRALGAVRESMEAAVGELAAAGDDALVPDTVPVGFARDMTHRLERLERRYRAAIRRREEERFRDMARLRGALYPGGIRQERALNLLPLMARHGHALLEAMMAGAREHAAALVGTGAARQARSGAAAASAAS
ncbi:MAG TPA: bacillithiol biosynthesis BshC [Gemmatimonadales bacterium]